MNELETISKEMKMFAVFGRSIFACQSIERILATYLTTMAVKTNRLSKARFDELLYENTKKTLGQLTRDLPALDVFSVEEIEKIGKAKDLRDYLAHEYLNERIVEFLKPEHWDKVTQELSGYYNFLGKVYDMISLKATNLLADHPEIDLNKIAKEFLEQDSTPIEESFRVLNRNEIVVDLFAYSNHPGYKIPIFKLEDGTYWTIGEKGLSQWKEPIDSKNIDKITTTEGIFPIKQFNPLPKIQSAWNYELDLKVKGLTFAVRSAEPPLHFRWSINKKA